jgi:hypothetical protein
MKRESRTVDRLNQVDSPTQRHLPLVDLLVDTRAELMELAVASGLKILHTMLEEDRTANGRGFAPSSCAPTPRPMSAKPDACSRIWHGDSRIATPVRRPVFAKGWRKPSPCSPSVFPIAYGNRSRSQMRSRV